MTFSGIAKLMSEQLVRAAVVGLKSDTKTSAPSRKDREKCWVRNLVVKGASCRSTVHCLT
jgi:hypothetical protein